MGILAVEEVAGGGSHQVLLPNSEAPALNKHAKSG